MLNTSSLPPPPTTLIGQRRPLSAEEAKAALERRRGLGTAAPTIKRLRPRHHGMAQALANGLAPGDVARAFGICASRMSILQADPAFAELVAGYSTAKADAFGDLSARLACLGLTAAEELLDRLDEDAEAFGNSELTAILKLAADRTGFGPTSKVQVERTLQADALAALKARIREAQGVTAETTGPDRPSENGTVAISPL